MQGRRLGRYRILEPLGEGGMGSVWRADDELLGRAVAVKLLPDNLADSPQARRRFLREARLVSVLDHPGLVTLYEAGEEDGRLFLVFALIEGRTVRELLRGGPMLTADAVRIATEAAEALGHAHARGVVHRDISPGNLMVNREGRTVVIDFGLALGANTSRITSSSATVGTAPYMPPEVISNCPMDHRGDVYSLGAVLYEMVVGRPPFRADQTAALIYSVLHDEVRPPSALRKEVDPRLDDVILRALARDPAARFARIEEFAGDLRATSGIEAIAPTAKRLGHMAEFGRSNVAIARTELAVLPFRHVGPAGEADVVAEHFARGLSDIVSAALARFARLQIVPPGHESATEGVPWRNLARQLGVHLILVGTVRKSDTHLRVSFSLIDGWLGEQVGGDTIEGTASDLFAFEDRLVAGIIRALNLEAVETVRVPALAATAAHEKYLQALGYLQRTDNEASVDGGIRLLEGLIHTEGSGALLQSALGRGYLRKYNLTFEHEWKDRAETSCRMALALDPHSPDVLITLGSVLYHSGRHDEAVAALQQSLDLNPGNADAWIELSYAREARGDLSGAEHAALESIALRPGSWRTHDRLALVRFRKGLFETAAAAWSRALELVPDNAMVITNLGSAYFHLGRLEDAEREYRRALGIAPGANTFSYLGTVLFFTQRSGEAVALFEKAVALRPKDARTWGNLADAQRWTRGLDAKSCLSFERAVVLTREHLAGNPASAEDWSRLGRWLAKLGKVEESVDATRRALDLAPEILAIHSRAATVFELAGNRESAVQSFEHALTSGYGRVELERDPELERLRQDPRVARLLSTGGNTDSGPGGR